MKGLPSISPFEFPLRRPVTITMIVLTALVLGSLSYRLLPIDIMPPINYPSLTVRTEYPGASPEEVEEIVTEPLEQNLGVVRNLVSITSSSRPGVSEIELEFNWETDINQALQDVRERLDQVILPEGVDIPSILRYDPKLDPLMRIALTSSTLPPQELRRLGEDFLKRELEKELGVAAVKVRGGEEVEIRIAVNPQVMELLKIPLETIAERLRQENISLASGTLKEGTNEYLVRSENEFLNTEEIAEIIINSRENKPIRLKDLARIERVGKEIQALTRVNGEPSVEIEIYREGDANPVIVSDRVRKKLIGSREKERFIKGIPPLADRLPAGVKVAIVADQALFIKRAVSEVKWAAIYGGILACAVIFFFLVSLRNTMILSLVIPISVISTFAAMKIFGLSINIMSLGGLALGVGMLVDCAIVVVESIWTQKQQTNKGKEAVVEGTRIVGSAVIASTLTTVVIFVPIIFVTGVARQVFKDLALTIIASLLISLTLALFFIPLLIHRLEGGEEMKSRLPSSSSIKNDGSFITKTIRFIMEALSATRTRLNSFRQVSYSWQALLTEGYKGTLQWSLKRPIAVITIAIFIIGIGYGFLLPRLGAELVPEFSPGTFDIHLEMPVGTPIDQTLKVAQRFESTILTYPEVKSCATRIGRELSSEAEMGTGAHSAILTVQLISKGGLKKLEEKVVKKIRILAKDIPGLAMRVSHPTLFTYKPPIQLILRRDNLDELKELGGKIISEMEQIPYFKDIETTIKPGYPEIVVNFDRVRLAMLGLTAYQAASNVRGMIHGELPTYFKEGEKRLDIRVNLEPFGELSKFNPQVVATSRSNPHHSELETLKRLVINPNQSTPVTLQDVATISIHEGSAEIRHYDGTRAAIISANVAGWDIEHSAQLLSRNLQKWGLFPGKDFIIAGQKQELETSLVSLRLALLLALFLVYGVMASQFESFGGPFLILLTVPVSLAAVIIFIYIFAIPLSIMVLLGLIILVGIMVNNAIILVDYIGKLRGQGIPVKDAITRAGERRLRPILMTSLTTVLGLLPMAIGFGEGAEIRRPMALVVIFGLTFSLFVSLVLIPTLYSLTVKSSVKSNDRSID